MSKTELTTFVVALLQKLFQKGIKNGIFTERKKRDIPKN